MLPSGFLWSHVSTGNMQKGVIIVKRIVKFSPSWISRSCLQVVNVNFLQVIFCCIFLLLSLKILDHLSDCLFNLFLDCLLLHTCIYVIILDHLLDLGSWIRHAIHKGPFRCFANNDTLFMNPSSLPHLFVNQQRRWSSQRAARLRLSLKNVQWPSQPSPSLLELGEHWTS